MIVVRLAKLKYCKDLSGKGAEKSGGRWNSKGVSMWLRWLEAKMTGPSGQHFISK